MGFAITTSLSLVLYPAEQNVFFCWNGGTCRNPRSPVLDMSQAISAGGFTSIEPSNPVLEYPACLHKIQNAQSRVVNLKLAVFDGQEQKKKK